MYMKKINKGDLKKNYSSIFLAVLLSLFLIFTVTILTGFTKIFPKKRYDVYDKDGKRVGEIYPIKNADIRQKIDDLFFENGIEPLKENDSIEVEDGGYISKALVKRGYRLAVEVNGETKMVDVKDKEVVKDVVEKALKEDSGDVVYLKDKDELNKVDGSGYVIFGKGPDDEVSDNLELSIDKFERKNINKEQKPISHETKEELDGEKKKGERETKQEGKDGVEEICVDKIFLNGKAIGEEVKRDVIKDSVPEIISVGAKEEKKEVKVEDKKDKNKTDIKEKPNEKLVKGSNPAPETPEISKTNSNVLEGFATAYPAKGRTYSGSPAVFGVCATDLKRMPLNARYRVYVQGSGKFYDVVVKDKCASACRGKVLLDLCLPTLQDCRNFGKKRVRVVRLDGPSAQNAEPVAKPPEPEKNVGKKNPKLNKSHKSGRRKR